MEAALVEHAAVGEAVVEAREGVGGERRLVAYVVGVAGLAGLREELRRHVRERLPEHMVPSGYVVLEEIPRTANGKVERRRLPEPEWGGSEGGAGAERRREPVEELMCGIWEEVLGVGRVGMEENFFELGGHSLLATRIVSRVREAFGVELPVREIFQTPTVAELSRRIESARGAGKSLHAPPLTKVSRDKPPVSSFAQERLWFLEQLEPGNSFYNVTTAVRLHGRLDVAALERALVEVVRRHETLRTTFESVDGQPVQVIASEPVLRVELEDLSGAGDEAEVEAAVRRRTTEEAVRPLDLARGPLFRCRLLKLHEDAHVLVLCIHHIISDGWSLEVLLRETSALYEAYNRGAESPLVEPEFQYRDYAAWQRGWMSGAEWDAHLAHWKERLAGAPAALELPTDRSRPAEPSYRGARRSFHLGEELTRGLRELSRRESVTTHMLLLAAFKALLYRYSGQTDIVVGTPVANRGRVKFEGLIGFFLNTLALRTDLSGDPTFVELLARVREVTLDGFAYQEFPFEKLVEELQPERSLSHAPLFQVMFTHQTLPPLGGGLGGLRAEAMQLDTSTSKFDLTLSVLEGESDLRVEIEYSTDLFGAARIERMEGHLTRLLREAVADAGRRISQLESLSEAEREQLTNVWNDTARESCGVQNVVELFERQARMTPDEPAVVCGAEQISYGRLHVWSNRLAHHLRRLGVGAESLVGVCTERSIDMVAAVIAVFKAGAAYVPLDPAYPQQRLSFMLAESRAEVVLTQQKLEGALQGYGGKVICLDADRAAIEAEDDDTPPRRAHLDNLGYVIYTSGSTGRPKGIGLPQRALLNLIEWHLGTMKTGARTLQFASLSFDASFHEMLAALCSGGTVIVASEEERKEVRRLAELLKRERVEKAILPVIVAQQLAEEGEGEEQDFGKLAEVTTTGEQLQVTAGMVRMFKRMSWSRLHNHYGPSESHVVTAYTMPAEPDAWVSYPPIGRPIWNTRMYVLDAQMKPTPVGVPGELYIGGVMLARGYLKRPGLTAEKFIPDRFSRAGGDRLYRTGDLARYLEDGNIEYLGRIDQQVKIRGYRVELEEIEAVLRSCAGVAEAAVQAVPDGRGGKRLVGYIAGGGEVSSEALVRHLRESLPDYMVPALYVKLDRLPLTSNGKLDRRALPVPDDRRDAARPFVAPRAGTEELLAGIWGRVLRRHDIDARDNFFELGGHSLLATQVVSRIREAFGVELELRALFDKPTVAELAHEVERLAGAGPTRPAPPLARAERGEPLPLSFAQQRLWFFDQLESGSPLYHVPISVKLTGPLNVVALVQALDEIMRRHEPLRTVFASEAGSPVQVIKPPTQLPFSLVDLTGLPEELKRREAVKAAAQEAARPFDLERGPLLRARLLRLSAQEHVALLTMHHIVSDGWSMAVLVREVGALYGAFASGGQSPLPELEVQYADYAVWQRRWLEGEPLEEQVAYWSRQLAGVPPSLELPTDRPRSAVRSYAGAHRRFRLRAETAQALKALCEREGVTLFMALVAAFKAFLARHCNQEDIVVGTDIAHRHHAGTEGLIGFFVNQLVLRTKLSGDPTFVELLKRVRAVALGAYAHQDMPFDKLVEVLNPGRGTGRTPLFQVKLVLQNAPAEPLELPGLKLEPLEDETETGTSRFDLMLTFVEDAAGLSGVMEYSTELFEAATAARLLGSFERLLESAVARPDARLTSLDIVTEAERAERVVRKKRREASGIERLKSVKPRTLSLSRQQFLKAGPLRPDAALPVLVEPSVDGVDLAEVIGGSRELIEQRLSTHGALLFRGFNVSRQADFEEFLRAMPYPLMRYMEGATPRTELGEKVYTSTEYPADQHIALHNELTYVTQWPMKIWFFCQQQPAAGGETPIADVRGVYQRIPARIRDRFVEKGWMLTRNFGQGLSLSWQTSFHTEQAAEVESYCRGARIEWEWRPGGGLRTRQTRPAVAQHPQTRELIWFNHVAFWHVSSLEEKVREAMLAMFREEDLPYNTYYGDGSRIEDSVVAEIREAYRQERLEFPWRAGDILMLDNMLVAHGRNPYSGARRVLVAMA
ncbi:MAG: amino acid adenylation domain-containing protein [Pyrinomonadaceae bacterium]